MRICVFGPSNSGKTTVARVLKAAAVPETAVIRGDEYIKRRSDDFNSIRRALEASSDFIFDHISAPLILQRFGLRCDLAVGLLPPVEVLQSRTRNQQESYGDVLRHYQRATQAAHATSDHVLSCKDSNQAIRESIQHLSNVGGRFFNPLSNFVVKIASRCNLNCSYCYMYHGADQTWAANPVFMSPVTAARVGERIAEHVVMNPSIKPTIILHGGEPLALQPRQFEQIVRAITAPLHATSHDIVVQTNGTRITNEYLELLDDLGVLIGISMDGASGTANRYRLYHSDKPAHADIVNGLFTSLRYPFRKARFVGVLCVIDPDADGQQTYSDLRSIGLTSFDFLLKDEHHASGRASPERALRFLIDAFEAWIDDATACDVRLFRTIICLILGADYRTDYIGLHTFNDICISVTGEWELLDVLRICFDGAWKTGLNIREQSLKDVVNSSAFKKALEWQFDLSDTCLQCRNLSVCGGGYLPHRYDRTRLFQNPSIYCETLYGLIDHIRDRLRAERVLQ